MNRTDRRELDALAGATRLAVDGATLDEAAQRLAFMNGDDLRAFLLDHRYVGTCKALETNPGLPPTSDFDRIIKGPEGATKNDRRPPRHAAR